jgi:tRNA(Leu) C34 or U34 (ribose-2'-O)-methylase TrmL
MSILVGLHQCKDPANLANIRRSIACYGGGDIQVSGKRILSALDVERLPRPLRDRRYATVKMDIHGQPSLTIPAGVVPVAIEVGGSQNLAFFEHPQDAMYIFGPEDGSIPPQLLSKCHHVVVIPTLHCLNLAVTVSTVLYDRMQKAWTRMNS